MTRIVGFVTYLAFAVFTYAVPPLLNYAGQVAANGEAFDGQGLFKFALVNTDGNVSYWSNDGTSANGSEPAAHVSIPVNGGLYSLLLGNTAISGMGAIDPQVFAQHGDAKLRVWFSDGVNGFQQLSPDRPFASVPYAFSAGTAETAGSVKIAEGSINKSMLGSDVIAELNKSVTITRAMLPDSVLNDLNKTVTITRAMLPQDVRDDLNRTVTITRDMLPQDVRDDLNKTLTITRSMLPADVLSDLNRTVSKSMLGSDVLADLNKSSSTASPITLSMLAPEVTEKLDRNTTTTNYNAPSVGSLLTVPYGQPAPTGYSLYQRGTPKELVWEEKAPVSVGRQIHNGAEVLDGKIYVVGGGDGTRRDLVERYDPNTNTWQTLNPLSSVRTALSVSLLQGKLYAIGGEDDSGDLATVEIYDPTNDSWTQGPSLPHALNNGNSIIFNNSIYLIGGNDADSKIATNFMLEANASDWVAKAPMSVARGGQRLVIFEDRIWAMGGNDSNSGHNYLNLVESYDPVSDSWRTEPSLPEKKQWASAWVANGKIYTAGGASASGVYERSIFSFSRETGWVSAGHLPENKGWADAVVLNDTVYVISGRSASNAYSNKVFAADLNASVADVYDLYRKDGNASAGTPLVQAEVADGSVTTAKLDTTILKYLKPEITAQPQAQTVYADTNVLFSVTAEGKYLSYQWKKDGGNLTGETNSTLTITDANATLHDGNYSVVVSNDFGSVESGLVEVKILEINLTRGLLAWWPFDGNGSDMSGNARHSTPSNTFSYVPGKVNQAIRVEGDKNDPHYGISGGHIIIPFISSLESGNFSISMWVKEEQMHYSHGENYISFGDFIYIGNRNGVTFNSQVDTSIIRNQWNHILFIFKTTSKIGFLNGENVVTENWAAPEVINLTISAISRHWWDNGNRSSTRLTGSFDDVRIYDRALSAAEVQALYNLGQ